MVFNTIIAEAQFAPEPTARNSKRFPVNANGDVRLRSVLSSNICGILPISSFNSFFTDGFTLPLLSLASISSSIFVNCVPKNTEMIDGGASFAPNLCSLPDDAMLALNKSACSCTALTVTIMKVRNCKFALGVCPGEYNEPTLLLSDQLLCLPEPLIPAKGFSCNNT